MAASMDPIYISESRVNEVLSWPMVTYAVEEALRATCRQNPDGQLPFSNQPARSFTFTEGKAGVLLTMPGFVGNYKSKDEKPASTLACKVVTCFKNNTSLSPAVPNILANILLFDAATGQLKAVMAATDITSWRTAAASIVATKHLYFSRASDGDDKIVSILGCGVQGQMHAIGFCSSFKEISEIRLWNRTAAKAHELAATLEQNRDQFMNSNIIISVFSTVERCVQNAHIIVTATFSPKPFLELAMVRQEAHINAVGAGVNHHSELTEELYQKGSVYVDNWVGARSELRDIGTDIVGEVGEIINGFSIPRQGITIFQSMGMASEDATVAQAVYETIMQ